MIILDGFDSTISWRWVLIFQIGWFIMMSTLFILITRSRCLFTRLSFCQFAQHIYRLLNNVKFTIYLSSFSFIQCIFPIFECISLKSREFFAGERWTWLIIKSTFNKFRSSFFIIADAILWFGSFVRWLVCLFFLNLILFTQFALWGMLNHFLSFTICMWRKYAFRLLYHFLYVSPILRHFKLIFIWIW